jgi:hypothetical protein
VLIDHQGFFVDPGSSKVLERERGLKTDFPIIRGGSGRLS